MTKFDPAAYEASLPAMSLAELCQRLRGQYPTAVTPYKAGPLAIEAARRLEALSEDIDLLTHTQLRTLQSANSKVLAENERLRAAIKGAEIAVTRDEDSDAAARILIEAQAERDPEVLPDGSLSKSTMRRRAATGKTD